MRGGGPDTQGVVVPTRLGEKFLNLVGCRFTLSPADSVVFHGVFGFKEGPRVL